MKIIDAEMVLEILDMSSCMGLMRRTLSELDRGLCVQPLRTIHRFPGEIVFGFMPAYLGEGRHFGAKVLNACHRNIGTEYPSHAGYVIIFESEHGTPVAMVDATSITAVRTGAVSGVATELLARTDASEVAIIGAGVQAYSHIDAMILAREIRKVTVFDTDVRASRRFAEETGKKYDLPVTTCETAEDAVRSADIVCTLTPATSPYLLRRHIRPGAHINAVGAFTPTAREISSDLVAAARLYADSVDSMKRECGEYLVPREEGIIDEGHIVGSIGGIINGTVLPRQDDEEITLFDALGLAVEDVACAEYVYERHSGSSGGAR